MKRLEFLFMILFLASCKDCPEAPIVVEGDPTIVTSVDTEDFYIEIDSIYFHGLYPYKEVDQLKEENMSLRFQLEMYKQLLNFAKEEIRYWGELYVKERAINTTLPCLFDTVQFIPEDSIWLDDLIYREEFIDTIPAKVE